MKIPTIEEIAEYIREKGYNHCDPMEFWYHYDSKGWTVGKVKMTKWKSAVAGWHLRNKKQAGNNNNKNSDLPVKTSPQQAIEVMAKDKGLTARPGETWEQFNLRVQRTRH